MNLRKLLFVAGILLIPLVGVCQITDWDWARKAASTTLSQTAIKIRSDKKGNVYLLAYSAGNSVYGHTQVGPGNFIVKYNSSGQLSWVRQPQTVTDIYPGNSEKLHIAGTFTGQLVIGSFSFSSSGSKDIFHAVYDEVGNIIHAKSFGDSLAETLYAMTVNERDETYMTGAFVSRTNLANQVLSDTNTSNLFVLKLDSGGAPLWSNKGPYTYRDGRFIGVDESDNVYVAGAYGYPCPTCSGMFLRKFDSEGTLLPQGASWGPWDPIFQMTVDRHGNVYVVHNTMSHYGEEAGITKFGPDLKVKATNYSYNNPYHGQAFHDGLAVDSKGSIFIAGRVGYVEWDPALPFAGHTFTPNGYFDMSILRLDSNCKIQTCIWDGNFGNEMYKALWIDQSDQLYAAGNFNLGNRPYDTLTLGSDVLLGDGNWQQAFAAKYTKGSFFLDIPSTETISPSIQIYPNPSTDLLVVQTSRPGLQRVKILDSRGTVLISEGASRHLNVRDLPSGLYFIQIEFEHSSVTRKIVVNHEM